MLAPRDLATVVGDRKVNMIQDLREEDWPFAHWVLGAVTLVSFLVALFRLGTL